MLIIINIESDLEDLVLQSNDDSVFLFLQQNESEDVGTVLHQHLLDLLKEIRLVDRTSHFLWSDDRDGPAISLGQNEDQSVHRYLEGCNVRTSFINHIMLLLSKSYAVQLILLREVQAAVLLLLDRRDSLTNLAILKIKLLKHFW